MDCVSVHRGSSHLQLHSHGCWEREKAWAADGAGSVMPATLATGGLFCVATHHPPRLTQCARGGRYGKAVAVHVLVFCLPLVTLVMWQVDVMMAIHRKS